MFKRTISGQKKTVKCDGRLEMVIKAALKAVNNDFEAFMEDYEPDVMAFCQVHDYHGKAYVKLMKDAKVLDVYDVTWPTDEYTWYVEKENKKAKHDNYNEADTDEQLFITSALKKDKRKAHCTHPDGRTCETRFDENSTAQGEFTIHDKEKKKKQKYFFVRVYDRF